jgi:glyceraldehyde-3-phosphate dehydrogenase (NAD(P))
MRVGIVGLGVIGKRVAAAVAGQPDFTLVGVAVRSPSPTVHAHRDLPLFAADLAASRALRDAGVPLCGLMDDLIGSVDVVVDAGPAQTGRSRVDRYRSAGASAVFCGGERDPGLGPLVHPALNPATAAGSPMVRLTSCNTTALARVVAAIGVDDVVDLDATILRCATDSDKASKGISNGVLLDPRPSHHASDLSVLAQGLCASSYVATVPMTCGHAILVRLRVRGVWTEALNRLRGASRVTVLDGDTPVDTAALRADALATGTRWAQRFDLVVRPCGRAAGGQQALWLSLDNQSITIPETLDVLRTRTGRQDSGVGGDR